MDIPGTSLQYYHPFKTSEELKDLLVRCFMEASVVQKRRKASAALDFVRGKVGQMCGRFEKVITKADTAQTRKLIASIKFELKKIEQIEPTLDALNDNRYKDELHVIILEEFKRVITRGKQCEERLLGIVDELWRERLHIYLRATFTGDQEKKKRILEGIKNLALAKSTACRRYLEDADIERLISDKIESVSRAFERNHINDAPIVLFRKIQALLQHRWPGYRDTVSKITTDQSLQHALESMTREVWSDSEVQTMTKNGNIPRDIVEKTINNEIIRLFESVVADTRLTRGLRLNAPLAEPDLDHLARRIEDLKF